MMCKGGVETRPAPSLIIMISDAQDTVMFNKDVYHNIHYGNFKKTRQDVMNACEAAQIRKLIEQLPEGWETKVRTLSSAAGKTRTSPETAVLRSNHS
jgi:ABC-type transport system involved in Fe-S cluster assembly fused permease/ATPase subunit